MLAAFAQRFLQCPPVTAHLPCTGPGGVERAGIGLRKAGFSPRGAFLSVFPLHTWIRLAGCQMSPPARERGTQSQWEVGGPLAQSCMN